MGVVFGGASPKSPDRWKLEMFLGVRRRAKVLTIRNLYPVDIGVYQVLL